MDCNILLMHIILRPFFVMINGIWHIFYFYTSFSTHDMWEVFERELSVSETVGQFLWGFSPLGAPVR